MINLIQVYGDGSSHAKGGLPGGWACVIVVDGEPVGCNSGSKDATTNNEMELTALVEGLIKVTPLRKIHPGVKLELISDSQYALGIANRTYYPVKNVELASALSSLVDELRAETVWIRGHSGNEFNERCDALAKLAKTERVLQLKVNK